MISSKRNKKKRFYWHLEGPWRKEPDPEEEPDPNPKVSGTDPQIRIRARTKMSGIHNTGPSYRGRTVY
jgi:hypothetical protein